MNTPFRNFPQKDQRNKNGVSQKTSFILWLSAARINHLKYFGNQWCVKWWVISLLLRYLQDGSLDRSLVCGWNCWGMQIPWHSECNESTAQIKHINMDNIVRTEPHLHVTKWSICISSVRKTILSCTLLIRPVFPLPHAHHFKWRKTTTKNVSMTKTRCWRAEK